MSQHKIGRRPLIAGGAGALGTMLARARPAAAQSVARRETLVVALDFSDTTTLDPGLTLAVLTTAPIPVMTPQAISDALSSGISRGMRATWLASTTTCSAKAPIRIP